MAGKSSHSSASQPERILQASFLIPSYKKALPHALLHVTSDDCRLRKIEATCGCKIGWGRLPSRLAERYCLLQIAFDPKRGNSLGAINLLRQYFLGNAALIPFNKTLLRPNGSQVTRKFPTSVDDCRLLMPHCDRFGRSSAAVDIAAVVTTETALRGDACQHLANRLTESCQRCLAMHAAFLETEAAQEKLAKASMAARREQEAVLQAAETLAAAAAETAAAVAFATETVAQCELSRGCVCAMVEVAESTRLLAQLDEGRRQRRRIAFQLNPQPSSTPQRVQQHQVTLTTTNQVNNHHRPASTRSRERKQALFEQLPLPEPPLILQQRHHYSRQLNRPYHHQRQHHQEDQSCATTLADVEAITFAESEYVDKPRISTEAKATAVPAAAAAAAAVSSSGLPESLLLWGLQPSAASALSALDRSDRRLKKVERRTGCRLELRERCCAGGVHSVTSQQVSYALQVLPIKPDARPRGCVNMLRTLLHRLDPSCRFSVVGVSEVPQSCSRSKSVDVQQSKEPRQNSRRRLRSQDQRLRRQARTPSPAPSPQQVIASAVAACTGRLVRLAIVDCLLGASSTTAATATAIAIAGNRQRRLELCREAVLGDALICIFRSLTTTEDDAVLLGEALDGGCSGRRQCDLTSTDAWFSSSSISADSEAPTEAEAFRIVCNAVHRTLITCVDERRVRCLLGPFACLPPLALEPSTGGVSDGSSTRTDEFTTATIIMSVRRRITRLTLTCWEHICSEALCSDASVGARDFLDAVVTEAATEAAFGQLTTARLTLGVVRRDVDGGDGDSSSSGSLVDEQHRRQQLLLLSRHKHLHRQQHQQHHQLQRRRSHQFRTTSSALIRRSLSVLAVKSILKDRLEAVIDGRVSMAAVVTHLAVGLITEQVWNVCLKTQLMLRLRLRSS